MEWALDKWVRVEWFSGVGLSRVVEWSPFV